MASSPSSITFDVGAADKNRDTPSTTARKVALNILALGSKPGMDEVLPAGIVEATAHLLVASGVVGEGALRFARATTPLSPSVVSSSPTAGLLRREAA